MGLFAIFGIHNDALNRAVSLLILFLVVIWLALIYWTYADARRRIADPMLVGCATLCSFFPFLGTIIYMILRPPEYLVDAREREIEIAAAEARLAELEQGCPYCGFRVEKNFLRCPSCLRRLKEPCQTCGKPLDPLWKICPYCESEIVGAPEVTAVVSEPSRRRGRRSSAASTLAEQPPPTRRPRGDGDAAAAPPGA
jgi:DNA-directed RNA polymerase subunit RPC12/RpoP